MSVPKRLLMKKARLNVEGEYGPEKRILPSSRRNSPLDWYRESAGARQVRKTAVASGAIEAAWPTAVFKSPSGSVREGRRPKRSSKRRTPTEKTSEFFAITRFARSSGATYGA